MDHRVTPHEMIRVSFMITGDVPADVVRFTALAPGGDNKFSTRGNFTKTRDDLRSRIGSRRARR